MPQAHASRAANDSSDAKARSDDRTTARQRMENSLSNRGQAATFRVEGIAMPEKKTKERARKALRQGKKASTAAGEFVHEEIEHIREGKHGARSAKQAIAIGLSKARRAGVPLRAPKKGATGKRTRTQAVRDLATGRKAARGGAKKPSPARSKASTRRLEREGRSAASRRALSRQAKQVARRRKSPRKPARSRARRSTR
jgi:hypothetical protein